MSAILVAMLAAFPVIYLSAFCHELGHALLGWASGFVVSSFGMGTARPFLVWKWQATRIYFCRTRPLQGLAFTFPRYLYPSRRQTVVWMAGGAFGNAVLTALGFGLWVWVPWGQPVWLTVAGLNAFLLIVTVVPCTVRVGNFRIRNDGGLILDVLRRRSVDRGPPYAIELANGLRRLWEEVGDTLGRYMFLVSAASGWLDLGILTEAEHLLLEAEAQPVNHLPMSRGYGALVRGRAATFAGKLELSRVALLEAEQSFAEMGQPEVKALMAFAKADLMTCEGDAPNASKILSALAAEPLGISQPDFALAVLEARLRAAVALDDDRTVERLRSQFENLRRRRVSATGDLHIYEALATYSTRRQLWDQAIADYQKAWQAAFALAEAFIVPANRELFAQRCSGLRAAALECVERSGPEVEKKAEPVFPTFDGLRALKREAGEKRVLSQLRLGLWLNAFGVAFAALAFWMIVNFLREVVSVGSMRLMWPLLAVLFQALCSGIGLLCGLALAIPRKNKAGYRREAALITLTLGVLPWLLVLAAVIAAIFAEEVV